MFACNWDRCDRKFDWSGDCAALRSTRVVDVEDRSSVVDEATVFAGLGFVDCLEVAEAGSGPMRSRFAPSMPQVT